MGQARSTRLVRAFLAVSLVGLVVASAQAHGTPPGQPFDGAQLAAVSWPPSTGLLVSEVVTGGASASDEFVEIYNASSETLDLAGLELVYVTSTGGTVTRKQTWTALAVPAHRHVLIANSSGVFAAGADGTYSGGLSATGGTAALRLVGGAVVDSLSWGDAASSFVEGTAGAAPPASSSLERKPGDAAGNSTDTNDNSVDATVNATPLPQPLTAPPAPADPPSPATTSTPDATPTSTDPPTDTPQPTSTPEPTPPCVTPSPTPTDSPTPGATVPDETPSPQPTPLPTSFESTAPGSSEPPSQPPAESPSALPTDTSTPAPTPTGTPVVESIAGARTMPLGSVIWLRGVLTTPFGLLDDGRHAYLDDGTGGISLLTDFDPPLLPVATDVMTAGVLTSLSGELSLEVVAPSDVTVFGAGSLPDPLQVATGLACEPFEARLIDVQGLVVAEPGQNSDGTMSVVDDGSGPLPVFAPTASGVGAQALIAGSRVDLVGVLGLVSDEPPICRLILRSIGDITVMAPPPTPTPTPVPTPTPTSSPVASPATIAIARTQPIGAIVHVAGTVTAGTGVILGGSAIAIQDATAGIYVRVPDGAPGGLVPGAIVDVLGGIAAPYGNLELRPAATGIHVVGSAAIPGARQITMAELGDATEGLLVHANAFVDRVDEGSTGTLTLIVHDASGDGRIYFDAPLGMSKSDFVVGEGVSVTGLVGDRLGLFRIWIRTPGDVVETSPAPTPTPRPTATPRPTGTPRPTSTPRPSTTPHPTPTPHATPTRRPTPTPHSTPSTRASATPGQPISIADALRRQGQVVTVEGVVTTRPGLLDSGGERVALQDATAGVLLRLPDGTNVSAGQKLRAAGTMGTYYGAPQLTGTSISSLGQAALAPTTVGGAPIAPALEWRLVTVSGIVDRVQRDGESWRAELTVSGGTIPISGIDRSGIPSTALVEGRAATVVGIVKRAYPTSTDQRLAVVPRSSNDISLGGQASNSSARPTNGNGSFPSSTSNAYTGGGAMPTGSGSVGSQGQHGDALAASPPAVTVIAALADHEGQVVRIGGRVVGVAVDAVLTVEDGTGRAAVALIGAAAALAPQLRVGDLLNITGTVERTPAGTLRIVVDDARSVARVPAPGSLADATDALAMASAATAALSTDQLPASATTSGNGALIVVATMLGLMAAGIVVLAVAGPTRRRRLVASLESRVEALRGRLQHVFARMQHG